MPDRYLCAWNQIRYQVGSVWGAKLRAAFVAAKQAGENPRTLKGGLRVALWHKLNDLRVAQSGQGSGPQQIPSADTIGNYLEEAMAKALSSLSASAHLTLAPAPGKDETSSFQATRPTSRGASAESTSVVGPSVQFDPRAVPGTGPAQPGWDNEHAPFPSVTPPNGGPGGGHAHPEWIGERDDPPPVPPGGYPLDQSVKTYGLWAAYGVVGLGVAGGAWWLLAGKKKRR
jgi:hypothetical protein